MNFEIDPLNGLRLESWGAYALDVGGEQPYPNRGFTEQHLHRPIQAHGKEKPVMDNITIVCATPQAPPVAMPGYRDVIARVPASPADNGCFGSIVDTAALAVLTVKPVPAFGADVPMGLPAWSPPV